MAVPPDHFAAKLKELRQAHNLTKERAAARVDVSVRQYHRWEEGNVEPRRGSLQKVADAYDLDLQGLIAELTGSPAGLNDRLGAIDGELAAVHHLLADLAATLAPELAEREAERRLDREAGSNARVPRASEKKRPAA